MRRRLLWIPASLIGVAAMLFTYLAFNKELRAARAALHRAGIVVPTAAGPIEYDEAGAGIPVLSIHGAGGGYDQGLMLGNEIFGAGYRIIAPSRFGYLRTPVPADISPAAQADAHNALLENLGVPKAIVMGVSAGARSAIEMAIRHADKVAALILIVPGTYSPASPVAVEESRASSFVLWLVNTGADFVWWALEKIAPSVLVRFIGVKPELVAASSKREQDRVGEIVRSIEPLSERFMGINIDSHPDLRPLPLEKISVPTLVTSARDDLFNTLPAAEYAAARIPGAKLIVFDTGGHLGVGRKEETRDNIRDFLAGIGLNPRRQRPCWVRCRRSGPLWRCPLLDQPAVPAVRNGHSARYVGSAPKPAVPRPARGDRISP